MTNGGEGHPQGADHRESAVPGGHIPFTPRAKRVLEDSYREAMRRGAILHLH